MSSTLQQPEAYCAAHVSKRASAAVEADVEKLDRAIAGWRKDPTTGRLGDVLAFSVAPECAERLMRFAKEAAQSEGKTSAQSFILDAISGGLGSSAGHDMAAEDSAYSICNPHTRNRVSEARRAFRLNPRNPLILLDLAQAKVASGQPRVAEGLLRGALSLSPNSRIVLRTLARFLVHAERPDEAHNLIARHGRTKADTWLMASEIALSQAAQTHSRFVSKGMRICKERLHSNENLSELAGALGGIALVHGNAKKGRELYRLALVAPNDNVLAQAVCDRAELSFDVSAVSPAKDKDAVEARTMLAFQSLDLEMARLHGLQWHSEEPFSSRPLQFLTSVLAAEGRYREASSLARRGLIADPDSGPLLGALAYSQACIEPSLGSAERLARRAIAKDPARMTGPATATLGLIAMRRGDWELGDALYRDAIALFESQRRPQMAALCWSYYARSAQLTDHPNKDALLTAALADFERHPSVDSAVILQSMYALESQLGSSAVSDPARRVRQAIYDPLKNELTIRERVSAKGAPLLITKR